VGRKKRQAFGGGGGGPGPGPGPAPPPVSADFQTASIFVKKYMELDAEDRVAIGHR
jgi:hypothetical protein